MKKMGGQNDKMNDKLIDIISNTIYSSQKGDEASRMSYPKASRQTIYNAYTFVTHCPEMYFLDVVSLHPTAHSTVLIKFPLANATTSVDVGLKNFSYEVKRHPAGLTISGAGNILSSSDIGAFYEMLLKISHTNNACDEK